MVVVIRVEVGGTMVVSTAVVVLSATVVVGTMMVAVSVGGHEVRVTVLTPADVVTMTVPSLLPSSLPSSLPALIEKG